jgi:tetratricopeptide (TPR) repeat protein
MDQDFNQEADELIAEGRLAEARTMLETVIREMPTGWKPCRDDGRSLSIAFWDQEEFLAYVQRHGSQSAKRIYWVPGSYSKAWYQLAVIAIEEERLKDALFCVDCGLEIEPDHPELLSEKGYVLGTLKRHDSALECYVRAASAREWAPALCTARAFRGQGIQLIDLDRLDEAETILKRSLEYEPESEGARNELEYLQNLRSQRQAEKKNVPWFLHAFANPPTDPLTVRLLALVEDLSSIPGPKTLGSDNYSCILRAFMNDGWAGFEKEFDRLVPRDRANYADVKRDLLREPIFNTKVHRRMAETFTEKKPAQEVFDEILR